MITIIRTKFEAIDSGLIDYGHRYFNASHTGYYVAMNKEDMQLSPLDYMQKITKQDLASWYYGLCALIAQEADDNKGECQINFDGSCMLRATFNDAKWVIAMTDEPVK